MDCRNHPDGEGHTEAAGDEQGAIPEPAGELAVRVSLHDRGRRADHREEPAELLLPPAERHTRPERNRHGITGERERGEQPREHERGQTRMLDRVADVREIPQLALDAVFRFE